jgi:hypothetical protein
MLSWVNGEAVSPGLAEMRAGLLAMHALGAGRSPDGNNSPTLVKARANLLWLLKIHLNAQNKAQTCAVLCRHVGRSDSQAEHVS